MLNHPQKPAQKRLLGQSGFHYVLEQSLFMSSLVFKSRVCLHSVMLDTLPSSDQEEFRVFQVYLFSQLLLIFHLGKFMSY